MDPIGMAMRRRRDRRRMKAAASAITATVVLGAALGVADVESDRRMPKEQGEIAHIEQASDSSPPIVMRPTAPPEGVTRAS